MPSRISQMRNEQQPQSQNQLQPQQINEEFLEQLKTLMKSKNAPEYITEIAKINPQFRQFVEMSKTRDLQPIFEYLARQRNVDPNWLLNQLLN